MSVNFMGYNIARSGLVVNDRALQVTGHNIANVNTTGYVRQQAMIANSNYVESGNDKFQIGLGAGIQEIRQIRMSFMDNIYRGENTNLGYWEARKNALEDVQAILGEPMGEGLQNVMNDFWDSWQELSKAPDSLTVRALVRQRGEAITQYVNHMGQQINKLQNDINSELNVKIDEVNELTKKVAALNVEITKQETAGNSANDYRDQRNTYLDKLTYLGNVDIYEAKDGQVDITLDGYYLVNKGEQTNLYAAESEAGALYYVPKLEGTNYTVDVKNGYICGLLEARGSIIGAKGSTENGTPNTKADITFVIDNSNGSNANLTNIKNSINEYVNQLKKSGLDYNLRLITYSTTATTNTSIWNKDNIDTIGSSFEEAVNSVVEDAGNTNDFSTVVINLDAISDFRSEASKYAVVFSGESIGGDEVDVEAFVTGYINTLNNKGIKTSVVTNTSYYDSGFPSGEVSGWSTITDGTGGSIFDIDSTAYNELMKDINSAINASVNKEIGFVEPSNGIVSNLKKKINALINIMAREVNSLHSNGKNLLGNDGTNFFDTINDAYPIEMGNLKLNDNIANVNNIVTGSSGANGDNEIALNISNVRYADIMTDYKGEMSVDKYYQNIISETANSGSDALRISENQKKLVNSADNYRNSVMGVSMDEEMSNMMKYKFAYNAASKALNAIDQMIDNIINRMGLVGR